LDDIMVFVVSWFPALAFKGTGVFGDIVPWAVEAPP
jgi:hypothetical protein